MKKLKITSNLFFMFAVVLSFHLTAQTEEEKSKTNELPSPLTTLFEKNDPAESDFNNIEIGHDEAWAGVETSDGGLLVVGHIEHGSVREAFITRYNFPHNNINDYNTDYSKRSRLVPGWNRINDIIAIGNDNYIIVGSSSNGGTLRQPGIAIITDLGSGSPDIWAQLKFVPYKMKKKKERNH